MALILTISAVISLLVGIIILIWPKSLNYAIAIWFLINGILQIFSNATL